MVNFDRHIAFQAGWIAGPAFGVAMMAAPEYFHLGQVWSAFLFWGGIGVFALTIIVLWVLYRREKESPRGATVTSMIIMLMVCSIVAFDLWDRRNIEVKRPNFQAYIMYTLLGQSLVNDKMTPGLFIFLALVNSGSIQSSVFNFNIMAKKDGSTYQGSIMGVPKTMIVTSLIPAIGGMKNMELHDEDVLYNKVITPVPPGGVVYGFFMVSFPNVSDFRILQGGSEINMTYNDVFLNDYTLRAIPGASTNVLPLIVLPGMHTEFH